VKIKDNNSYKSLNLNKKMAKLYHPYKAQEREHKQPNNSNVKIEDIHLIDYGGGLTAFFIKKINKGCFSSERKGTGKGLKAVICTPYQNSTILTQKGNLFIGRNCRYNHNIQVYVDFVKQNFKRLLEEKDSN